MSNKVKLTVVPKIGAHKLPDRKSSFISKKNIISNNEQYIDYRSFSSRKLK